MRRELQRRLAQAENAAWAAGWADRKQADHRRGLRFCVSLCTFIRARFLVMGIDPALAVSLQRGDEAAAELAAIPDSEALERADDEMARIEIARSGAAEQTREASEYRSQMMQKAARFHDGSQPDFANASPFTLFVYCIAVEQLAWGESPVLDAIAPAPV